MSKTKHQPITWSSYQEKGLDFYQQINELDDLAQSTIQPKRSSAHLLKELERDNTIKKELEQWKMEMALSGKKLSPIEVAKKTAELQDEHYGDFTPYQRRTAILRHDYNNQNFKGRGKELLIAEIDELMKIIKPFSLSKENKENKKLLNTMKSLVKGLEELEKMKEELRHPKAVSTEENKEKPSPFSILMKRKTKSDSTEKETKQEGAKKQKTSQNDMLTQREKHFKTGKPSLGCKQEVLDMEEMDNPRNSISVC